MSSGLLRDAAGPDVFGGIVEIVSVTDESCS
jgi:hypothetical protein